MQGQGQRQGALQDQARLCCAWLSTLWRLLGTAQVVAPVPASCAGAASMRAAVLHGLQGCDPKPAAGEAAGAQ